MRQEHPNGEVKENKVLLFTGLGLSAAAFLLAVVPFIVFLVPGGVSDGSPLVTSGIYINAFALAAALAGVIVTAPLRRRKAEPLLLRGRLPRRHGVLCALHRLRRRDPPPRDRLTAANPTKHNKGHKSAALPRFLIVE